MSKSRSVSRSVLGRTISVDASYAQELVEFWTQKYERVRGELDQIKETSVAASSPRESSEEKESEISSVTEYEESKLDALRASNEDLRNQLAASEQQRLELSQQIQALLAQTRVLASEASVLRQHEIDSRYSPAAFFPAGANPSTFLCSSPQALSEKLSGGTLGGYPICFLPRPPACLPLWVTTCGQHGYWFSPVNTYPEDVEFELVVEGKPAEWTYLGRYKSVHLPGGEMRLSEWLALDDETKTVHCTRVAGQRLGKDAATPAAVSAAAAELKRQIHPAGAHSIARRYNPDQEA